MDFNSKYTGQQVEALLDIVSQGGSSGGEGGTITEAELLAMGFTKNLGTITEVKINGASKGTSGVVDLGNVITEHQDISGKQDKITDLDAIREGASLGASAVQPEDIPSEVELITISGDMLADEPTYTTAEAQAIIDAYNANKLIAIKCGARINFGKGWFIPNINIRTQSGMSQIFLSGILGNYYIEHRIVFDTSAGTISATTGILIDLSESGGGATTAYVDQAIANAITNTLNTPV